MSRVDREVQYVDRVLADDTVDVVPLKSVQVTPLAAQILAHLQRQTGQRRGEILDRLLREYGTEFEAVA